MAYKSKQPTKEEVMEVLRIQRLTYPAAMARAREKISRYLALQVSSDAAYRKAKKKNPNKTRAKSIKDMLHYEVR